MTTFSFEGIAGVWGKDSWDREEISVASGALDVGMVGVCGNERWERDPSVAGLISSTGSAVKV